MLPAFVCGTMMVYFVHCTSNTAKRTSCCRPQTRRYGVKAMVTGASSGIGRELALRLAADGYELILAGRSEKRLQEVALEAGSSAEIVCADLSDRDECFRLYQHVKGADIQVTVNSAGFGVFGPFSDTDLGSELAMLDVNIESVHILTKLFLKDFRKKNYGYILNVASAAAFLPGPLFSSYYASKAYVLRLTQAIREELRREKSDVYIGALCPGPVATAFDKTAGVSSSLPGMAPDEVARYALRSMYRRKSIIIPGFQMKAVQALSKILPDALMVRLAWQSQNRKRS